MPTFKLKTNEQRKYLIIIVVILLFFTIYKYLVNPLFINLAGVEEEISLKEKMLKKYQDELREKEGLAERTSQLKNVITRSESGLLSGTIPTLATVDIQNKLKKIVEESNVEVTTMKILEPEDSEYYQIIPVQFNFTSGIRELRDIVYRIENSSTYLTIKEFRIRSKKGRSTNYQNWEISTTLTVAGYMKKPK